jgi:hypothetical protein
MSGKGDGRRPGKDYAANYDNIFSIDDAREKRDGEDGLNARRDEVRLTCKILGFDEEQTEAVLEDMGL